MDSLTMSIIPQLRPCIVDNEECLFHTWDTIMEPVPPSILRGGRTGGQLAYTVGLVEKADGTVVQVHPSSIKFVDSLHEEIWSGGTYRDANKNC